LGSGALCCGVLRRAVIGHAVPPPFVAITQALLPQLLLLSLQTDPGSLPCCVLPTTCNVCCMHVVRHRVPALLPCCCAVLCCALWMCWGVLGSACLSQQWHGSDPRCVTAVAAAMFRAQSCHPIVGMLLLCSCRFFLTQVDASAVSAVNVQQPQHAYSGASACSSSTVTAMNAHEHTPHVRVMRDKEPYVDLKVSINIVGGCKRTALDPCHVATVGLQLSSTNPALMLHQVC
jgi:hypothetical protein